MSSESLDQRVWAAGGEVGKKAEGGEIVKGFEHQTGFYI